MEGFNTSQVVRLTGVNQKTLHYWDHSGFLSPGVQLASGTGTRRIYSFRDLVALRAAHDLRERGVSLQGLRKVVDYIHVIDDVEHPLAQCYLVTDGRDVFIQEGSTAISALRSPGQGCLMVVVDIGRVVDELLSRQEVLVQAGPGWRTARAGEG